jgi:hypothetical protein
MRASLLPALALVLAASAAGAQEGPSEAAIEEARGHFETGTRAFDTGDYELAVSEFRAAYGLTSHPDLLFNIYSAGERAGLLEVAAEALERYLADGDMTGDRRSALGQRLARLRLRLEAQQARPEPEPEPEPLLPPPEVTPPPMPPAPPETRIAPVGWAVLGAGVALLVPFGIFAALSQSEADAYRSSCQAGACDEDAEGRLRTFNLVADISWIAAAVVGLTGLVLVLTVREEVPEETVELRVAPWAVPTGAGLALGGRFR